MSDDMKNYLSEFIDKGLVYRANNYDFLLLKDLIEFARADQLDIKIRDLKKLLVSGKWKEKKAAVSTTEGYQSKDVWLAPVRVIKARAVPIIATPRKNLAEAEEAEAVKMIIELFERAPRLSDLPASVHFSEDNAEIIFTNKGLKDLLELLDANGAIPKIASIIRAKSNKVLVGEHFFGTSSRTVLFKNYYKLKRG